MVVYGCLLLSSTPRRELFTEKDPSKRAGLLQTQVIGFVPLLPVVSVSVPVSASVSLSVSVSDSVVSVVSVVSVCLLVIN